MFSILVLSSCSKGGFSNDRLPSLPPVVTTNPNAATADKILSGYQAIDFHGNTIAGTMVNRGALDLSAAFPGAGYFGGTMIHLPQASQLTKGTTFFGIVGTAGSFSDAMQSQAMRTAGSGVLTLSDEINQGTCSDGTSATRYTCEAASANWNPTALPAHYRIIPDDTQDDEGLLGPSANYAPRPSVDCGNAGTLAARAQDCAAQNPETAAWTGVSPWALVTRTGAQEVWRDLKTGLLWSSLVAQKANWCQADGSIETAPLSFRQSYNTAPGTAIFGNGSLTVLSGGQFSNLEEFTATFTSPASITLSNSPCSNGGTWSGAITANVGSTATYTNPGICSFSITQGDMPFAMGDTFLLKNALSNSSCTPGGGSQPAQPVSYCTEAAGLNPPAGETWAAGGYAVAKGRMGLNSADKALWRLPTMNDYYLADLNGIRLVMPDMGAGGTSRPSPDTSAGAQSGQLEWTATAYSGLRGAAMNFGAGTGRVLGYGYGTQWPVRCVGR